MNKDERNNEILGAVLHLKNDVFFQRFLKHIVVPEIESVHKLLESETNQFLIGRLQGRIESLKKIQDLEKIEKTYKVKVSNKNGKDKP